MAVEPAVPPGDSAATGLERLPAIGRVAVLGAGTMGAQIAAHFANAGVPALLLDLTRDVAREGLARARRLKPDPFFSPDAVSLVTIGGFDTDLADIALADWIVEAVLEQLDAKQALLARIEPLRTPGTIVSTNTSGIPIRQLAEGRSDEFRAHWLGTHFFNPPRYLHLLEVIPSADTASAVVHAVTRFSDRRLGKGTVIAKDAPNFIGNRVALHGVMLAIRAVESGRWSVDEVDAITGPALGRPKSATFRTMDIAGLDVLAQVCRNLYQRLPAPERDAFAPVPLVDALVARGWVGEKAGRGFYTRERTVSGESEILVLDPAAMTYRPRQRLRLPALDTVRSVEKAADRVRMLFHGQDRVGTFLRETLAPTLVYAAQVAPDIAYSIDDVDRALRWGFGWDLGPFELIDAIGRGAVIDAWRATGDRSPLPPLLESRVPGQAFRAGPVPVPGPGLQVLRDARERSRVVRSNPGASLVDLDDGVLAVELHSKMNVIGGDTLEMLRAGVAEAERNHLALVIGTEAVNFSAGANLMLLLLEAQEGNWGEIDLMVRSFQAATTGLRASRVPVVVATRGLTIGGGCEVVLHAAHVQAAAESYIGLVEAGVGLVPAGAGTKEMLARAVETLPAGSDLLPAVQRVFETIGFGKVSTSAHDAFTHGYLRGRDGTTMNPDRLIADAKARALVLAREGYRPPPTRTAIRVGGDSLRASLSLGVHLAWRAGRMSDHDAIIGRKLAWILAGGSIPHETIVSESYLLDLEREAFLALCGERKTLERIQYTLKTGKTLRN
jgi:3-hydroxyacyl-CoA dehydrogenase